MFSTLNSRLFKTVVFTTLDMMSFSKCSVLIFLLIFSPFAGALTCAELFSPTQSRPTLDTELIEGIVKLEGLQEIPPAIFDKFTVNDIAKAIVERVRRHEQQFKNDLVKEKHSEVETLKETDVILFFWDNDVQSINKRGFLNQYLSGKSSGGYFPERMKLAEDNFTGILLGESQISLELRPKYAFLNIRDNVELAKKNYKVIDHYGNIGAVLKSEIKERTLWTSKDSLLLGISYPFTDLSGKSLLPYRGTLFRGSLPCRSSCIRYYEALVYGHIDFSHVEYFLVEVASSAEVLKKLGRPIYLLDAQKRHNRVIFEKGKLLYEGE